MVIFHCYVSSPEGNRKNIWSVLSLFYGIPWNSSWDSWAIAGPKALSDGSSGMDHECHGPLKRSVFGVKNPPRNIRNLHLGCPLSLSVVPHWSNIFDDFPSYKTPYVPIGFPGHFSLEGKANNKALIEWYTQLTQSETHTKRTRNAQIKGPADRFDPSWEPELVSSPIFLLLPWCKNIWKVA